MTGPQAEPGLLVLVDPGCQAPGPHSAGRTSLLHLVHSLLPLCPASQRSPAEAGLEILRQFNTALIYPHLAYSSFTRVDKPVIVLIYVLENK